MSDWTPPGDGWRPDDDDEVDGDEGHEADEGPIEIRVVTPTPIPLRLEVVDREEVREGERAFATFINDADASPRPIAVNSLPAEIVDSLVTSGLFDQPRHIMASLHEEGGGLRGLISALVPADQMERWAREQDEDSESEPWRASLPDVPSFEADAEEDDESADEEHATAVVPIPLGVILRFPENRRHPDDVVREAADLVASVLGGYGMDAKQKRIDDLLGGL